MSFIAELKRRNVLRVGTAYIVAAWLVIQVVETLFPIYGLGDGAIRLVITLLAIGLVPTVIFAWAFELTPDGLKRDSEVDRSQSIAPDTGRKLDRMIMVVLALALGYFAFDKFVLEPQREAALKEQKVAAVEAAREQGRVEALIASYGDNSIAVLPFVNMSDDAGNEYFSDGISEELLNLLASIPELRVVSRTSAFFYKDKDVKLRQVAEELNVAHILEGSVRKAGDRVRITAQLIEARSDTHLWSETYDRRLDDIFAIQDEIALMVVEQLRITLLGEAPHVAQADPEAYALQLQARALRRQRTPEAYEQAVALYQQALAVDPAYPTAWTGLALTYINQATIAQRPLAEGYALAREAVDRALALDPNYALAHSGLAWIAMRRDGNLAAAAGHFRHALALAPADPDILGNASALAISLGRAEQAVVVNEYLSAQDPVNPTGHGNMGFYYLYAQRPDDAIASFRRALQLSPGYRAARYGIGVALLMKGEAEAALAEMQQEPSEAWRMVGLPMAYHALGRGAESDAALAELIARHEQDWAYNIAYVFAYRGEGDRVFEWLDKAVAAQDTGLAEITVQHLFGEFRDDPRWLPLLRTLGRAPDQLAAIEFEIPLPRR